MAAPNLASPTTITAKETAYKPTGTTEVVLLPNAASSGKVFRIKSVVVANVDGTNAVNATVKRYTNGAVAQGSAPSGGTGYEKASTVSVPANATLVLLDATTGGYLEEGTSLTIISGTASKLVFSVVYEEIS